MKGKQNGKRGCPNNGHSFTEKQVDIEMETRGIGDLT